MKKYISILLGAVAAINRPPGLGLRISEQ